MNPTISCNALAIITTPQTLKIKGHIEKKMNNLTFAQNRMKKQAYQHCNEIIFDIGD